MVSLYKNEEEQKKQKIRIEVRTASYVIRRPYKKWKP